MDRQEYLNQISAQATPAKKGLPAFFTSKIFWAIMACVAVIILICAIGGAISSNREPPQYRLYRLLLQIDNTRATVDDYQDDLKSSTLRGYSASLSSILSNTSSELTAYLSAVYQYKPKTVPTTLRDEATAHNDELNNDLFVAKINGNLDEIFDVKMLYEISLIGNQEDTILQNTTNQDLINIFTPSFDSLSTLYDDFDEWTVGL